MIHHVGPVNLLRTSRTLPILLAVAFIAATLLTHWRVQQHPEVRILVDSKEYIAVAENLLKSGVLYGTDLQKPPQLAYYTKRPPGYPVMIAVPLGLGWGLTGVVAVQILLSLIGAFLVFRITGILDFSLRARYLVCAIYLIYPAQLIYSQLIMAEILFQFFLLLSLFGVAKFIQTKGASYLLILNLTLGLASLTKPVIVYFWLPNILFHLWICFRRRRRSLAAYSLIPVLLISGWCYRNYLVTGYFHYSSIRSISLYLRLGPADRERLYPGMVTSDPGEFQLWNQAVAETFIQERAGNLEKTIKYQFRGLLGYFLDPGRFDIFQVTGTPHITRALTLLNSRPEDLLPKLLELPTGFLVYLICLLVFNLVATVSFVLFLLHRGHPSELRAFMAAVVFYSVIVTGALGVSRYRLSIEPFLLISLPCLDNWLKARLGRR